MQTNRRNLLAVAIKSVLVTTLAWTLTGCRAQPAEWPELGYEKDGISTSRKSRSRSTLRIEPVSSQEIADLSPDDVVRIAKRIGFTDQQILDLGPDLHNALLLSGAARVRYKDQVEALLRVQGDHVLIYSRSRGSHVYNLTRGDFRIGPSGSSR